MNSKRFQGKNVIIAGGAGGVGRAASLLFAAEGASVCIFDIQDDAGRRTVAEIEAAGGSARYLSTDVSKSELVTRSVEKIMVDWDRVDVLFNHAGTVIVKPFLETTEADWRRLMDINFMSMVFVSQSVIPHMLRAGGGTIVNTASISGLTASALESAYCTTKGACIQLTRSIAAEFRDQHIRCNAISPAFIRTDHGLREIKELTEQGKPVTEQSIAKKQGRFCEPEEVARVVLFLASNDSSFINGEVIVVDNAVLSTT